MDEVAEAPCEDLGKPEDQRHDRPEINGSLRDELSDESERVTEVDREEGWPLEPAFEVASNPELLEVGVLEL